MLHHSDREIAQTRCIVDLRKGSGSRYQRLVSPHPEVHDFASIIIIIILSSKPE